MKDLTDLSSYYYHLPTELIAQKPLAQRDDSRLMIIDRSAGTITHKTFKEIIQYLSPHHLLIMNNTKVIPARLLGHKKETGAKIEVLLIDKIDTLSWNVLVKPFKRVTPGTTIIFSKNFYCTITSKLQDGVCIAQFVWEGSFEETLSHYGMMPLPPYIKRKIQNNDRAFDFQRYQTVFADISGSIAAPTAGLHFTENILQAIKQKQIDLDFITLNVGLGTFEPVRVTNIMTHKMHRERYSISVETANKVNLAKKQDKHILTIGTTTLRALESSTDRTNMVQHGDHQTDIFIYPGYQFRIVNSLLTNFHLPESTLFMLVCAFSGYDLMMTAYESAVQEQYRFFSYGDCMLIL